MDLSMFVQYFIAIGLGSAVGGLIVAFFSYLDRE